MSTHRLLVLVPVTTSSCGAQSLRVVRRPDGARVGVAFTSLDLLHEVLGPDQEHVRMSLAAVHAVLAGTGVEEVRLDPTYAACPAPVRAA